MCPLLLSIMADRYIFDSNVILQYPEVLARIEGKKVVLPQSVLDELHVAKVRGVQGRIQQLVADAIAKGIHVARTPESSVLEMIASDRNALRLNGADISIAALAIEYAAKMGKAAVVVVTADRGLTSFLSSKGIRSITGAAFLSEPSLGQADIQIQAATRAIVFKQWGYIALCLAFAISVLIPAIFAFRHISEIISAFHVWGFFSGILLLGVLFYWLREHVQLTYGVVEYVIGASTTYYVLFQKHSPWQFGYSDAFGILGGLYVMVRGLDNVGKGFVGTRIEPFWKRIFQSRHASAQP
jgi:rRNA maturation endonuclease Nob1